MNQIEGRRWDGRWTFHVQELHPAMRIAFLEIFEIVLPGVCDGDGAAPVQIVAGVISNARPHFENGQAGHRNPQAGEVFKPSRRMADVEIGMELQGGRRGNDIKSRSLDHPLDDFFDVAHSVV